MPVPRHRGKKRLQRMLFLDKLQPSVGQTPKVADFGASLPPATLRQPTPAMSARRTTPESNFPLSALPEPQDYIAGYARARFGH